MRKQERGQCSLDRHCAMFTGAGAIRESSHDLHVIVSELRIKCPTSNR